ncbi:hypothetical protein BGZ52_001224 [Haplosporangium bisporale]|nr:hypothetical protein BGZ52_001224 [Haplosporangium bisporale]
MPVLLDDMQSLKAQILQATLVLTHVVQTMSVPSPTALLDVVSKRDPHPHPRGKDIARDQECNCASLHVQDLDMQRQGLHFLVAYYSPDPWEFQSRIIRHIACMQQELDALRQESLEVQKRATIQLRKEVMESERKRDVEWVELNERMLNTLLLAVDDDEEGSEYYRKASEKELERIKADELKEGSEGKRVRVADNNKPSTKNRLEEPVWNTKESTIPVTWAAAVTPLAGGPLFPSKVRDEEGFGREVFWAGDYSSSQFSPTPAPRCKEE